MSNVYPFKSGAQVLFDSGGFEVAFGMSEASNAMRVGVRWKDSDSTFAFPHTKHGALCYVEISQELDLAFLATLLSGDAANDAKVTKAMKTLILQGEKK